MTIKVSEKQKQLIILKYTVERLSVDNIIAQGYFLGSRDTLRRKLREWEIPPQFVQKCTIVDFEKEILEPWKAGESINSLSRKYHISKDKLSTLLKQSGQIIVNPKTILKFNLHIFDVIDTEEKAYWLGFIFADGNISSVKDFSKQAQYRFTLTLCIKDLEHLKKFNTFMGHCKENIIYPKSINKCCSWQITNKHLWEILNSYGCTPKKSLTLQFPKKEVFSDPKLVRHFIRGYWDGDGCISYDKRKDSVVPRLSAVGTKQFLLKIKNGLNLISPIVLDKRSEKYYVLKLNTSESKKFMKYLYSNCSIYLNRKYTRYKILSLNCVYLEDFEKFLVNEA